jgi:hypothetical protein
MELGKAIALLVGRVLLAVIVLPAAGAGRYSFDHELRKRI